MLATVEAHGAVRARDMAPSTTGATPEAGGWWDWHPSKAALEYLWRTGRLAVTRREAFQKVYDLSERVIPQRFHTPHPSLREHEVIDWAIS